MVETIGAYPLPRERTLILGALLALAAAAWGVLIWQSMAMGDAYPAPLPSATWAFQIGSPVFLSSATTVASLPPGLQMSLSPSMSGDSQYAHVPRLA